MEFQKVLEGRHSIRSFTGEDVTAQELTALAAAAAMSPSWKNSQVSRFYAARGEKRAAVYEALPDFNKRSTAGAGAYVVTTVINGISGFAPSGEPATHIGPGFQYFDNGLAVENLCLKAADMGLGTLILGLYDEKALREFFKIPESEIVVCVIAVGRPTGTPRCPKKKPAEEVLKIIE